MFNQFEGLDDRIADSFPAIRKAADSMPDGKGKPIVVTFNIAETGQFGLYLLAPDGSLQSWRQAVIKPPQEPLETLEQLRARYEHLIDCQKGLAAFAVEKGWVQNIDEVISWWVYILAQTA
jgi:hypothetical protein